MACRGGEPKGARLQRVTRDGQAGYHRFISRIMSYCGGRSDLGNPEPNEAPASVLVPGGSENPIELVTLAERACKDSQNVPSALWSLSLAHSRAEQWEKALARAKEAIARRPERRKNETNSSRKFISRNRVGIRALRCQSTLTAFIKWLAILQ
jgi:hypothetical protein